MDWNSVSQAGRTPLRGSRGDPISRPATAELRSAWTAEGGRPYASLDGRGAPVSPSSIFCFFLLFASFWALGGGGCLRMMTDVGSENPENYVFGNVGGVVRYAL